MLTLGSGPIYAAPWVAGGPLTQVGPLTLGTATTGGVLSNGTYFVRVSAVTAAGEGTPSAEQSIVLAGGTATQTITVTIPAVAGATSYNVYISSVAGFETLQGSTATTSYTQSTAVTTTGAQARFIGLLAIGEVGGDVEWDISYTSKEFYGQSAFAIARAFYNGKALAKAKKVELVLDNVRALLAAAWAQQGTVGAGSDTYALTATTLPVPLYVKFVHTRSDDPTKTVVIEGYRATIPALNMPFHREDFAQMDLEFEFMPDSTLSNQLLLVTATQ